MRLVERGMMFRASSVRGATSMGVAAALLLAGSGIGARQPSGAKQAAAGQAGIRLEDITWQAAQQRLTADTVVVLPLGAGAEQHGPHLRLDTDLRLANYLSRRLLAVGDVVVAPALPYHFSPPFVEYPGSTSIAMNTARDLTADVARSLARHGARRFYVLNTSLAAGQALFESARLLAADGILLRHTDVRARLDATIRKVQRQVVGNHADEIETSMMLFIDPEAVDMTRAVREYGTPSTPFRLTRRGGGPGTYSESGVWGDATLATRDKGRELVEALVPAIRSDIEDLRRAGLPAAAPAGSAPRTSTRPAGPPDRFGRRPDECLPGDDRTIRSIGPQFYIAWMHQDAERLAAFWAPEGDMVHPDGLIEGSAQVIRQNRASLFMRPEYKNSRHSLTIGQIRCITGEVAIADAKWDLRGLTDAKGQAIPPMDGLCTLVLERTGGAWRIEAYRYSINPQNAGRPTLFQRPGLPDTFK
jgi:creatinine amidohydrolase